MDPSSINREVFKAFKIRGLSLQADASKALNSVLSREDDPLGSLNLILGEIKDRIEKRDIKNAVIDLETITSIVADLSSTVEDLSKESTQLFDAFNSPKLEFDERQKTYKVMHPIANLHATAESKAKMFKERLLLAQQRLLRSGNFALRGMGTQAVNDKVLLSSIDSLLGVRDTRVLLGLLSRPTEGSWSLEDLGSIVALNFSKM